MQSKAIAALFLIFIIIASGCLDEQKPQTRDTAIEFARQDPGFMSFLAEYPYSEIVARKIEKEESGLFENPIILEQAERECGKSFRERAYWHVKAKQSGEQMSLLLNEAMTEVECRIGEETCRRQQDCDDQDPCTVDKCGRVTEKCTHLQIITCQSNDGCCLKECRTTSDSDCQEQPRPGPAPGPTPEPTPPALDIDCNKTEECNDGNPCTSEYCYPQTGKCVYVNRLDREVCGTERVCDATCERVTAAECRSGECIYVAFNNPTEYSDYFPTVEELTALGLNTLSIDCRESGQGMFSEPSYTCRYQVKKSGKIYYFGVSVTWWDLVKYPQYEEKPEENYAIWEKNWEEHQTIKQGFVGEKSQLVRNDSSTQYSRITLGFIKNNILIHFERNVEKEEVTLQDYELLQHVSIKVSEKIGGKIEQGLCSNSEYETDWAVVGNTTERIPRLTATSNIKLVEEVNSRGDSAVLDISDLDCLQAFYLQGTNFSKTSYLSGFTNLKSLGLSDTSVSDLSPLRNLTKLIQINLSSTPVSDISPLKQLKNLTYVNLLNTSVSQEDCQSLQLSLPNARIICPSQPTPGCQTASDCFDGNACTNDTCSDGKCWYPKIRSCTDNDGCCPSDCPSTQDNDCSPGLCLLTSSDGKCHADCTRETDWDCCIDSGGCWINYGGYKCYEDGELNASNDLYGCDPSKSTTRWTALPAPDLVVSDIIFFPEEMIVGQPASVTVYVKNIGTAAAGNFSVGWDNELNELPCTRDHYSIWVTGLLPEQVKTVRFELDCQQFRLRKTWHARVDLTSNVKELSEINNSSGEMAPFIWYADNWEFKEGDFILDLNSASYFAGRADLKIAAVTQVTSGGPYVANFELYNYKGELVDQVALEAGEFVNQRLYDSEGRLVITDTVYINSISVDPATSMATVTISSQR